MNLAGDGTSVRAPRRRGRAAALLAGLVVTLTACTTNTPTPAASSTPESGGTSGAGTGTAGLGGTSGGATSAPVPDIAFTPITGTVL